jgi:hypothetical protein
MHEAARQQAISYGGRDEAIVTIKSGTARRDDA